MMDQQSPHQTPQSPLLTPPSPSQPVPHSPHLMSTPQSPLTPASVPHSPAPQHHPVSNNNPPNSASNLSEENSIHKSGSGGQHDSKFSNVAASEDLLDVHDESEINALLFNTEENILQDGSHDEPTPHQSDAVSIHLKVHPKTPPT